MSRRPTFNRRHPAAIGVLILLALLVTGGAYAAVAPKTAEASTAVATADAANGKKLFTANCATCHGPNGAGIEDVGPSLVGVGAASVDFQVGTGRMPLVNISQQAPRIDKTTFTQDEIDDMAAYVASLGPGPAVPADHSGEDADPGRGGELFRVNCAMCHNSAGAGGALTRGKYAPKVTGVDSKYVYEAMLTGPQSMPVFNDTNITPQEKRDVIAYLEAQQEAGNPGGNPLGSLGPVPEGLFAWTIGLGLLVAAAVWLGKKSA